MKRLFLPIFLITFVVSASGQDARERTARISSISKLSATTSGDRGTFSVSSVETLNARQFSFGIGWDNFDRTPRDLDINSVPIFMSYGITERVTVTAGLDAMKQVVARNLPQTGFFNRLPFINSRYESGIGDATIRVKYRLQRKADNVGGMSLSTFVKFPNAEVARGLGTGRIDAGLELGFTSLLPLNILMHSTTGVLATSDANQPSVRVLKDELRSGIGVAWPAAGISVPGSGAIQGIFEYSNVTFIGAGAPNDAIQAPTDISVGIRYLNLGNGLSLSAGYRRNTNFDKTFAGNDESNGFMFGLSYTQPGEELSTNNFPVVVLDPEAERLGAGSSMSITARSFDADSETLTYFWTSTGGTIEGSGETVSFNSAGLVPGPYVIRVVVTDPRGGSAQAELTLTVE